MMELPLGFGMALAQNPRAMAYFSRQTEEKQEEIPVKENKVSLEIRPFEIKTLVVY